MIAVLNLGISNLTSVLNALEFLKIDFRVANTTEEFNKSSKFILPGVGTFAAGMNALESKRFIEPLKKDEKADFYYIHSFSDYPENNDAVSVLTEDINIVGAIQQDNIYGCQFHPEKSYNAGLKILREFSRL